MSRDPVPFRARRSMAAAALGQELFLFGGVGGATGGESILDVADDLWVYDTAEGTWRAAERDATWPEPRRCAGWAAQGHSLYLWGGSGVSEHGYTFLADLWRLDRDEGWERLAAEGPRARYTPVFRPVDDGRILLFSGYTEDSLGKRTLDDAWLLTENAWEPLPPTASRARPSRRYGATSAGDDRRVVVFGGFGDAGDLNDAWLYAGGAWECLSSGNGSPDAVPPARYCAAAALRGDRLIVFGGRSRSNPKANYNDLWALDVPTGRWELVQASGPSRYDARATRPGYHAKSASAVASGFLYVWGGEGAAGHVSDFWRLDLETLRWELLSPTRPDDPILW